MVRHRIRRCTAFFCFGRYNYYFLRENALDVKKTLYLRVQNLNYWLWFGGNEFLTTVPAFFVST